jgi:sugar phosphate isomerase/epimerase
MKRAVVMFAVLALCLGVLATGLEAGQKVVLPRYPDLKVGFTTWNFSKQMPVNLANAKKWVDYAAEQGFAWIELRDPGAILTLAECNELSVYAKQRDIEVIYATMVGLLDPNFWEVYSRAIANSSVFDGPRIARTALPGLEYAADPKKTAWTLAEFTKIVDTANQAANMARMFGLRYMVENATETLKGDGVTSFGTTEFFANVNANVGLQLDTANFFVTSRVPAKADDARAFVEKYAGKMGYVHVKTATKDNKPSPVLDENPRLIFEIVFWQAYKNKASYLAIEIPQPNTLEEVFANTKKSVEYLTQNY